MIWLPFYSALRMAMAGTGARIRTIDGPFGVDFRITDGRRAATAHVSRFEVLLAAADRPQIPLLIAREVRRRWDRP